MKKVAPRRRRIRRREPLLVDGAPVSVRLLDEGPRQPYCLLNKKKSG